MNEAAEAGCAGAIMLTYRALSVASATAVNRPNALRGVHGPLDQGQGGESDRPQDPTYLGTWLMAMEELYQGDRVRQLPGAAGGARIALRRGAAIPLHPS
jgi:hypothetical protein